MPMNRHSLRSPVAPGRLQHPGLCAVRDQEGVVVLPPGAGGGAAAALPVLLQESNNGVQRAAGGVSSLQA
eukprot:CAMPEP_0194590786 /NCGR_PEP_ID=MMETSP0292-20121207/21613_1 /TAXON_ID=39354 /ORGANISM="Heterosigma akashiwo, Strain CCMP2393" /LENGTH=69 /DNA_ID=CAMNT_0039448607 /DNA_START=123 /DNA_END=332 /DNA_ORIENTATION=+